MKTKWQTKKLGEICRIELGRTPSRGNIKFWDIEKQTHNVWLSIADLLNADGNVISNSKEYISNSGAELSKVVKKGTLLASFKLTLGRLAFAGKDLYTNEAIAALTIKNAKELSKEYLYHYLTFFDWHGAVKGDIKIKGKTLNKAKLKEIDILFPSLSEQKRIVKILDDVFGKVTLAKENTKKNLQNSKELFESYLQNIFANPGKDWEEKKLGEIADVKGGKRVPRGYKLKNDHTNHPYITVSDFNENGSIDIDNIRYVDDVIFEQIKRYTISSRDLYISIAGTIGKTGIIPKELEGANLTENACKLVFKENIDNKFVYYFTKSRDFLNQAGLNTRVAAMPKLALSRLSTISFFIPKSFTDQKAIVKKLDTLSKDTKKLENNYKHKLLDLDELRKSILNKAFTQAL